MKAIKLTTAESEAVERAYYEASSFEALMAVLCRQLNADAHDSVPPAERWRKYDDC